ncbi:MAG: glycosyltransferase family 39 protein [Anaerolineae bacterium]|nr:glycosyltransferase family 39 protein [Anaerolineae bacterium]
MTAAKRRNLWVMTLVLLVAAGAILSHLDDLSMWYDELFAVTHAGGTLEQILRDRDTVWPPGYYVILHTWIQIVGRHDVALRLLSALSGMLAAACIYRAAKRLAGPHAGPRAGWLAALAFGAANYITYYTTEVRAYALSLMFGAALAWVHLRWVTKPTWRRTAVYFPLVALWPYLHFTSGIVIALTGAHVLLRAPRRLWRWIAVMVAAGVVFLPMLPQFLLGFTLQSGARQTALESVDVTEALAVMYRAYSNYHDLILAVILVAAIAGLVEAARRASHTQRADLAWVALWGPGLMVITYITPLRSVMFSSRYLLIVAPAVFILIGWGLARLPRPAQAAGAVLILVLAIPWNPFEFRVPYTDAPPVRDLVRALAEKQRPGDVLVVDPNCGGGPEGLAWKYYQSIYYPGGQIPTAADGDQAPGSVWYLVRQGSENPAVTASVARGRVKTNRFWGPWYFIATYYEKPPLAPGYAVGADGLHFRGARIEPSPGPYIPGDTIRVESWWSTDAPLPDDYSFGLYLVRTDGATLVAENNGAPAGELMPVTQTAFWEPGALYRDEREIRIPWGIDGGYYGLWFAVYRWQDGTRLPPAPEAPQQASCLALDGFEIVSWGLYNR